MYKLKPNAPDFQACDGPFEGRKYIAGTTYAEIPTNEADKFEEIKTEEPTETGRKAQSQKPAAKDKEE
jgi:hypothetical protein